MSEVDETQESRIADALEKTLNSHGYGFQYSVLNSASQLFIQNESAWTFVAAEVPVAVQGSSTRIDFVLRRKLWRDSYPLFLLAECKRANPAISNWCFARAPFVLRARRHEPIILEHLECDANSTPHAYTKSTPFLENAYHIALEVKTGTKGDNAGQGRGAIEDAATQVLRGLNGMINFLSTNQQMLGTEAKADFLPVIFTTANLWTTEANLKEADINDGNTDLASAGVQARDWVALQYHQSPGLKHSYKALQQPNEIDQYMDMYYIRTVFIVSARGIAPFLEWASHPLLNQ